MSWFAVIESALAGILFVTVVRSYKLTGWRKFGAFLAASFVNATLLLIFGVI